MNNFAWRWNLKNFELWRQDYFSWILDFSFLDVSYLDEIEGVEGVGVEGDIQKVGVVEDRGDDVPEDGIGVGRRHDERSAFRRPRHEESAAEGAGFGR